MANQLGKETVKALSKKFNLDLDISIPWYGSLQVACELFQKARDENKSILLFVHGFNKDVEDVLKAAHEIEQLHNVIVVPFTWPANGGGAVSGTLSYKSDKSDARVSAGALNRAIGKIQQFHLLLTAARKKQLQQRADKKCPDNPVAAHSHFVRLMEKDCSVTLNLLCHSMGNYVLKHTLSTSENISSKLVFDNINLVGYASSDESNPESLASLRADLVSKLLIEKHGMNGERIRVQTKVIDGGSSKVEIYIVAGGQ